MKVWVLATLLVILLPSVMAWSYRPRRDHDDDHRHHHHHDRCCVPDQYESLVKVQLAGNEPSTSKGYGRVAMDFKRKLFAMNQTLAPGSATITDTIYDGKAHVLYTVNFVTGSCSAVQTPGLEIPQRCVSRKDAQPVDLGSDGDASAKPGLFTFVENSVTISLVMNMNDCTMMKRAVMHGDSGMRVENYFDTTIGIRDRSVLNIPAACLEAARNQQQ